MAMKKKELRRIMDFEGRFKAFRHKNYNAFAVRGPVGAWLGYVEIPKGHPWYKKHYDEIDAWVHGGLTYSGERIPIHNMMETDWVIGFDCAHYDDLVPGLFFDMGYCGGTYKDIHFVRTELVGLIEQAVEAHVKENCVA